MNIGWNLNELQGKDFNEIRGNEFRSSFTAFIPNLSSLLGPITLKTINKNHVNGKTNFLDVSNVIITLSNLSTFLTNIWEFIYIYIYIVLIYYIVSFDKNHRIINNIYSVFKTEL